MEKIKALFKKYRDIISYGFFGLCSTIVNIVAYYLLYNIAGVPNVISAALAWLIGVGFAFISNKLWVFNSKSWDRKTVIHETVTFFSARVLTGLLDVLIMYVAVDVCHFNSTLWKCISNAVVIILNYIASKLVIFKKK
ncbi:MAG: GtrA family protein [Ruminiclostridium sp.]|nr:GtrA family protein [Ruminiclostridium sp.]